ncbi:class I SAM-dependent methyltransferase [Maricaulis sp. CAU 1757]
MTEPVPIRQAYSEWAGVYDSNDNTTRDLDALILRGSDVDIDGARVIELGAGTGKNTAWLAARAAHILALDVTPEMLDRGRARGLGEHVEWRQHDIREPWPIDPGQADLVTANLVLEHVDTLAPVMAEAARALKPGGEFYISELHPFRQLMGRQARIDTSTGSTLVEAYLHTVSEYVGQALSCGFALAGMSEHIEAGRTIGPGTAPRLLVMRFRRQK